MWQPDIATQDAFGALVETIVSSLGEILGIDETIPGCEVVNLDTFGTAILPRYITVRMPGQGVGGGYQQAVYWRGSNPVLAVGNSVTVLHSRAGNRYEVSGMGGSGGASPPTALGTGAANQVTYWTGVNTVAGDAGLTYNAGTDTLFLANSLTFTGATGVNDITVPDNVADALSLDDGGGLNYLQVVSTNAQPVVWWNPASADIDFHVSATGEANALFVRGSDGNVGRGTINPDRKSHTEVADAVTAAITYGQRLTHITSGAAAALFGAGEEHELEDAGGAFQVASEVVTLWAVATAGSEIPLRRWTTYPAGVAGPGYCGFVTLNDVAGVAQTIIPNGAGDVASGATITYRLSESGGGVAGNVVMVNNGASVNLYNVGGETCTLSVNADGSVSVVRSAGTSTYDVALFIVWL